MKASIITIGNELLAGFTVDTNSAWLGRRFANRGISVSKKVSVADDVHAICRELETALLDKSDFIILTGGLGPTHDDITVDAVSDLLNLKRTIDTDYLNELKLKFGKRGMKMPENNTNQAYVYTGSEIIPNAGGSARGLAVKKNNSSIFVLPGVPYEMKQMFVDTIESEYLPECDKKCIVTLRTMGIAESRLAEKIQVVLDKWAETLMVAFLPSHLGVDVRLTIQPDNDLNLDIITEEFKRSIGKYFFGLDEEKLEEVVLSKLQSQRKTLVVAESCSGGNLARFITSVSGSSNVFLGGVVAYNNDLKTKLLNIDPKVIEKNGAVSETVAEQMALAVRDKTGADVGIGITGISGPTGGTLEKPVGLVYIALSDAIKVNVRRFVLIDQRILHQEMTSYVALDMTRRWCDGQQ